MKRTPPREYSASAEDSEDSGTCSDRHLGRSGPLGLGQCGVVAVSTAPQAELYGGWKCDDIRHPGEDAKEHTSQDDGANRGELVLERIEVAETLGPRTELEKDASLGASD